MITSPSQCQVEGRYRIGRENKMLLMEVAGLITATCFSLTHQGRDGVGGVGFSCQDLGSLWCKRMQMALVTRPTAAALFT
jgi:hypothetical protein